MTAVKALVGVIMGSRSDLDTMQAASDVLAEFGVPHEVQIVSAHRTPERMSEYARTAEARGLEVIIAGAGGAAHLPGMVASQTVLPVLGVPVQSKALSGLDSLLSIVQMPGGIPVGTLAIGTAGINRASSSAMIPSTTSNSTSERPRRIGLIVHSRIERVTEPYTHQDVAGGSFCAKKPHAKRCGHRVNAPSSSAR